MSKITVVNVWQGVDKVLVWHERRVNEENFELLMTSIYWGPYDSMPSRETWIIGPYKDRKKEFKYTIQVQFLFESSTKGPIYLVRRWRATTGQDQYELADDSLWYMHAGEFHILAIHHAFDTDLMLNEECKQAIRDYMLAFSSDKDSNDRFINVTPGGDKVWIVGQGGTGMWVDRWDTFCANPESMAVDPSDKDASWLPTWALE